MLTDTIVAVATAIGQSSVGIVRISGPKAFQIAEEIFRSPKNIAFNQFKANTINFGYIVDGDKVIDEVLLSIFKAPKSYTGEDVIEVNCHGGSIPIKKTMELILKKGARLAEPGEFTKRAFLNGRIDLSQAEAIMDLISAKTDLSLNVATSHVLGKLSAKVQEINEIIISALAYIEATIDYPDEVFEEGDTLKIKESLLEGVEKLEKLLTTSKAGKILREGIKTTIVGKPNVGKSSLLNRLLNSQRAIVTDIPGTTRDILEEQISIRGIPMILVDTAGIRETEDVVEKIGVERSKKAIEESDLILFVLDGSRSWDIYDQQILELLQGKNVIVLLNKRDLEQVLTKEEVQNITGYQEVIEISVNEDINLDKLEEGIIKTYELKDLISRSDEVLISNIRHEKSLQDAKINLEDAIKNIENGLPLDIIAIDLRDAWENLGKVTGQTLNKGIIDEIFSRFCLGK
ncbi:tRNA uridine-5-carboxymethylaminomethyl(34) synthesis GTPase MnmE [Anaerobranca gottschalkii]|uniref:tRNA modification GTPase MnmE n=1 Tax=Anaerobranca gottschalkii DSM 13577 TaxID=1120990 RepID=A0A1I0B563_9FIRM|nr:tRNA uridine-5-carboxymethylaminomethyl(34) synthesis GTPase MnmE [Anaerobranca gottschalkii]SET01240.1 tRNA modification GTPase [Anaerobranca gottschalkii DSM 13577]